ncbi:gamma carbonic anhydrase family protein [Bradyrhizobium sp. U87765 SZCCT0131]|uniref:gamma carbonic anhydrase family protein n=1 Tax=unclassified Bradyrhizobium TaxID=2631580 RepID=UPI001BA703B3|nr:MULTISPECIES: gamma carbonic anhydrase family protein [unclassified Bradyrhizobium]MBR1219774.1 gamma carbonic anhydrase family protein [Bradyrhizobium sp. U87765 SZCCT0131]MBR1262425.1 gamma carbonic anhydrase family protein [Bradyrhizobium sp. U87765 SZCCT0134]MBR1308392.1 gamma carbonic anhydrase family protein [Bradyrhizobium sp. U87765 SZCCT0110]MBR1318207.1 gamma carbonic anhydrase family protein [Bradyrhizobium sp. U87765 SZCCT0109]MBR1351910.1 gamma carbonic anhydrase family protein
MTSLFGPDVRDLGAAFIEPSARIYGAVEIGAGASVWCNAVIRAECQRVVIGPQSNVQDFVMIHVGLDTPTLIGARCSITHHVTLHGCTVEDDCLIGIGATIMDRCVIGRGSIVAGGAFLTEGTVIPPHSIVMGAPGKVTRSRDNTAANRMNALLYHRNALAYAAGNYRVWSQPELLAEVVAEQARHAATTAP